MTAAAIAVRNADVPLETPGKAIHLDFTGLVKISPCDSKRDRLAFADELIGLCSIGKFDAPAGKRCRQDLDFE